MVFVLHEYSEAVETAASFVIRADREFACNILNIPVGPDKHAHFIHLIQRGKYGPDIFFFLTRGNNLSTELKFLLPKVW